MNFDPSKNFATSKEFDGYLLAKAEVAKIQ